VDEFGPLNLQPRPGRQWAAVGGKNAEPGRAPWPRMRATDTRTAGVRHLVAAYELGEDKVFGHIKPRKTRGRFLEFCRYLRSLYPPALRIAIVWDNFSPHLLLRRCGELGHRVAARACYPDAGTAHGDSAGIVELVAGPGQHPDRGAGGGVQLGRRVAARVCYPDAGSVHGDSAGIVELVAGPGQHPDRGALSDM
jgi:hypothetical protein